MIKVFLALLAIFGAISVTAVICACMMSSEISQREERYGVYKDDDTRRT